MWFELGIKGCVLPDLWTDSFCCCIASFLVKALLYYCRPAPPPGLISISTAHMQALCGLVSNRNASLSLMPSCRAQFCEQRCELHRRGLVPPGRLSMFFLDLKSHSCHQWLAVCSYFQASRIPASRMDKVIRGSKVPSFSAALPYAACVPVSERWSTVHHLSTFAQRLSIS